MADGRRFEGYAGTVTWAGLASGLVQADLLRRAQGRWLDAVGLGPRETPYRTIAADPGWRLRRYEAAPQAAGGSGPVLLIVPAPIKRPYIWDLCPRVSVVRAALARGVRVYLLEWVETGAAGCHLGVHACAGQVIPDAAAHAAADAGVPAVLVAAHSLGGTLAAVAAAAAPAAMGGLVLLEAPLRFGAAAGAFAPWVAAAPDAGRIAALLGDVPGAFLDVAVAAMAPEPFVWARRRDAAASAADPEALDTHLRVARWSLDEFPLPGRLFADLVERLYRRDAFFRGDLTVSGRRAGAADLHLPLLTVANPDSTVIPPESVRPVHEAAPHPASRHLWYEGDRGVMVQHVGVLVGRTAHRRLWPEILDWLAARWAEA